MERDRYVWLRNSFFPALPGLVFMAGVATINVAINPGFVSYMGSTALTSTPVLFLGLAEIFVLIAGEVDLSVGAGLSLINVVTVSAYSDYGTGSLVFLLVPIAMGLLLGLVNGALVGFGRQNSFLGTIATASVWTGVAFFVMNQPRGSVPAWFAQSFAQGLGGIPMEVWLILLAAGIWFVFRLHSISNYLYASGSNARATFATGIDVNRMKFYAFVLGGLMMGLAGLAMSGIIASGDPQIGQQLILPPILAALVGEASFSGGSGNGIGTIGAAIGLTFMQNLIFSLGIPFFYRDLVYNSIIIVLIAILTYLRLRGGRG